MEAWQGLSPDPLTVDLQPSASSVSGCECDVILLIM